MGRDWWKGPPSTSTSTTDGFIGSSEIADEEVLTRNLRALAVTAAKLGASAVTAAKIDTGAVTAAKIDTGAVTAVKLSTDSVTTDKMTDLTVTSCKLSANAIARSVTIPFPKLLTTWGANLSSAYVVYQPIVPINIQAFYVVNMAAMENSTTDKVVLFRNSSSCVGQAGWTSISTAVAAGTLSCVGTVNNALVAADTPITMQTIFSTCSVSAAGYLTIHYLTTA